MLNYNGVINKFTYDIHKALNGYIPYDDIYQMVGLQYSRALYYYKGNTKFNTFLTNGLVLLKNTLLRKYLKGTLTSYGTNKYTDIDEVPLNEANFPVYEDAEDNSVLLSDLRGYLNKKEMEYAKFILTSNNPTDNEIRKKMDMTRGNFRTFKRKVQNKLKGVLH